MAERSRGNIVTLIACSALFLVLNAGQRSWMPPSGISTAVRQLQGRTTTVPVVLAAVTSRLSMM